MDLLLSLAIFNTWWNIVLSKRTARTMLCLLLFGPLLKKFAHPWFKTSLSARNVYGSIPGPVKSDTVANS